MAEEAPTLWIDGDELVVQAAHRQWRMDRRHKLDELLDDMDARALADERIPYWAELWPSSLALADFLINHKEAWGQGLAIDLGCGCGYLAMVASHAGMNILACDYLPEALACARANAAHNDVYVPFLCMDWRSPPLAPGSVGRLWGADIVYERRNFEPLLSFMNIVLRQDGAAYIAEPGRGLFKDFLQMATHCGWTASALATRKVSDLYAKDIPVTIWKFERSFP